MQRCVFLLKPFTARRWRRRYDLSISVMVWVVVGLGCSPFILMRNSSAGVTTQATAYSLVATSTLNPLTDAKLNPAYTNPSVRPLTKFGCFKDLPTRRLPLSLTVAMMALAELFGFLLPLAAISYSSVRIARSLNRRHAQDQQSSTVTLNPLARQRLHSVLSTSQADKTSEDREKLRALQMVLSCSALFLLCFAPYHLNFLLYLMVEQDIVSHCATRLAVLQFHPVSLCLASLSCCLNPLLYYFLTAEFRSHLTRRTASFTSSLFSSSLSPPVQRPAQRRLTSVESNYSDEE